MIKDIIKCAVARKKHPLLEVLERSRFAKKNNLTCGSFKINSFTRRQKL